MLFLLLLLPPAQLPLRAEPETGERQELERVLSLVPSLTQEERQTLREMVERGRSGTAGGGQNPARDDAVVGFFSGGESPSLVPQTEFRDTISSKLSGLSAPVGVETLLLYRLPAQARTVENLPLLIYRIMQSVSTMEGITYYSVSKGRERLLFEKSYRVENASGGKRLEDPVPERLPANETIYLLQEDTTFGENIYAVTYRAQQNAIMLSMENLTSLKLSIFTAVKPEGLRLYLEVIPAGEYILVYGAAGARTAHIPFLASRAEESFYNRIIALYEWFTDRLEQQIDDYAAPAAGGHLKNGGK